MPSTETLLSELVEVVRVSMIFYCFNPLELNDLEPESYTNQARDVINVMRTTKRLFPFLEIKGLYTHELYNKLKEFYDL